MASHETPHQSEIAVDPEVGRGDVGIATPMIPTTETLGTGTRSAIGIGTMARLGIETMTATSRARREEAAIEREIAMMTGVIETDTAAMTEIDTGEIGIDRKLDNLGLLIDRYDTPQTCTKYIQTELR